MHWHINPTKLAIHNKLVSTKSIDDDYGIKVIYSLNGKLHNPNGPAITYYDINGGILHEEYWINGEPD